MWYLTRSNKYGNKRTEYNGRTYDSKQEAKLAADIDLLVKSGEVVEVVPQRAYSLYGRSGTRICTHRPDFTLTFKDGHQEVWEAKGKQTPDYRIKLKLFRDNYPNIRYLIATKDKWAYV